jgi:OmcA/MtrC family decaheme c-type cytochrome
MRISHTLWGSTAVVLALLAGCGGGGGGSAPVAPVVTPAAAATVKDQITAAAAVATNDTATNSLASFSAVQAAGVPAVTINSPPKVNFAVFSDGKVKSDLVIANVSFAIAKLVPGTNGNPDQWVNYIYRKETATAGVGPGGVPALASAMQATTDGKQTDAALLAAQLVYNPDGYYTYTFKTDIKDVTQTNGVVFEPGRTHRIAIQLSYKNAAGDTVLVNPYIDFTVDANGQSVPVTDPTKTRKMTDISSCNSCHEKLGLHGGGRVDTQYCVLCHNPGTIDANSGNVLNLATMAHKIHSGKLLNSKLATGGGEDYTIWGYQNSKHDYAEVGFPQDLRNCTKCHSAANPATPQGDNWKTMVTKEACLTCHANNAGSDWDNNHQKYAADPAFGLAAGAKAKDLTNKQCADCHKVGSNISPERVHWNQNEENAAKYKMNIESVVYDATARKATVKYFLSDPTNGNAAYNLVTPDCTGTATITCSSSTKFGNLRFYLAYQNIVGQSTATTEYSSYNNGGSAANAYAYKGTNDGSNHYTVDIALPADVAGLSVAFGTARVVSIGQIKEPLLAVKAATDPRPEVVPRVLVNVIAQHTFKEVALSGTLQPRRTIVATEKCNACHGALGTTSGSNTLSEAFHSGGRDIVEACVVCHDPNRASNGNMMTNGLNLYEPYQLKRMIHGIHGNSRRVNPFTHGNKVVGAFNKDGTSMTAGGAPLAAGVENYAAEVAWPGVGINCNACHVNNSYKQDQGTLGAVVFKDTGVTDVNLWKVMSPKAASCTACHDSSTAIAHVTSFGGASFGDKTQAQIAAAPRETCDDCHAPGGFKGVDLVHGQK